MASVPPVKAAPALPAALPAAVDDDVLAVADQQDGQPGSPDQAAPASPGSPVKGSEAAGSAELLVVMKELLAVNKQQLAEQKEHQVVLAGCLDEMKVLWKGQADCLAVLERMASGQQRAAGAGQAVMAAWHDGLQWDQEHETPAWLRDAWVEWMEFEERGTQPGQPTLSVPYLRHAYKSLTCQGVLIEMACNSAACLMKLRQLEHSVHFTEKRTECGFSLLSEVERKWYRCRAEKAHFCEKADLAGMAATQADWVTYRNDAIDLRWRANLAVGLWSAVWFRCWRV